MMIHRSKPFIPLALLLMVIAAPLGGCGDKSDKADAGGADPKLVAEGQQIFNEQCSVCHDLQRTDAIKVGPPLAGVIGRKSGSYPGFEYSRAFEQAGFTWDAAHLDTYLTDPQTMVPGNAMGFFGLPDAETRKALIAFLSTQKE